MHNCFAVKSSPVALRLTNNYIHSFRVLTNGLENHSFIHLSYITNATRGGIFQQFFYNNNYKFLRYAHHLS